MRGFWSHSELRRLVIWRGIELVVLLAIVGACFWAYRVVYKMRVALEEEQLRLVEQPQYLQHFSALRGDLRGRSSDIERILALVIDGGDIVSFIAHLEETAKSFDVSLEVPSIVEVPERDETEQLIEASGPFRSIQLTIKGLGEPANLLEFIHKLEHDQQLVALPEWEISTDAGSEAAFRQTYGLVVGGEGSAMEPESPSVLSAELILVVHNEKYSSQ